MLYRFFTGAFPFRQGTVVQYLTHVLADPPFEITDFAPTLPPDVCALVMRALEKDPTARTKDATAMELELLACLPSLEAYERSDGTTSRKHVFRAPVLPCPNADDTTLLAPKAPLGRASRAVRYALVIVVGLAIGLAAAGVGSLRAHGKLGHLPFVDADDGARAAESAPAPTASTPATVDTLASAAVPENAAPRAAESASAAGSTTPSRPPTRVAHPAPRTTPGSVATIAPSTTATAPLLNEERIPKVL
jgi:hypothetical protein